MEQIDLGELKGYNETLSYCFKILDFIKEMNKKQDYHEIKKLASNEYELAYERIMCTIQVLQFLQYYEKYGKDLDLKKINTYHLNDLLSQFSINEKNNISFEEKEKIFRNCLAHGRYSLAMDKNGEIKVTFNDPKENVTGKIPFFSFIRLSHLYINALNMDRQRVNVNQFTDYNAIKKYSQKKKYETLFNNTSVTTIEENRNFKLEKEIDDLGQKMRSSKDIDELHQIESNLYTDIYKNVSANKISIRELSKEEMQFLIKYIEFCGVKNFNSNFALFQLNNIKKTQCLEKMEKIKKILNNTDRADRTDSLIKQMQDLWHEFTKACIETQDYAKWIEIALKSKNDNLVSIYNSEGTDISSFVSLINHLDELGSQERIGYKDLDSQASFYFKDMFGTESLAFHNVSRDYYLKYLLKWYESITPTLYTNMLISLVYYAIGYAKEVNANYKNKIFAFKDIDLEGINPIFDDYNRPSIRTINLNEKAIKKLSAVQTEKRDPAIRSLKKSLNFGGDNKNMFDGLKKSIQKELDSDLVDLSSIDEMKTFLADYLNKLKIEIDNGKNQDYILQNDNGNKIIQRLEGYIEILQKNSEIIEDAKIQKAIQFMVNKLKDAIDSIKKLSEAKKELSDLEKQVSDTEGLVPYTDSSVFFSHIRNSITHSWYKIDYYSMFDSKDFEKVIFDFQDFDKDEKTNTLVKTFEVNLSGAELRKLIEEVRKKVYEKSPDDRIIDMENINLEDIRDENNILRYDETKYDRKNNPITSGKYKTGGENIILRENSEDMDK